MPLYTVDLCAGIGGIRRGFEMTGHYQNVLSAEIDEFACKTYEHLFHDNPRHDITKEDFKELIATTNYDVLLAGFPCQTFSRAGREEGFSDKEKGIIFNHIALIIEKTRPKGVFLENVDNLIRHDNGNTMRVIINKLETELNYKVIGVNRGLDGLPVYNGRDFVRNSKYFGVPQNRPRTYIMAFDRDRYDEDAVDRLPGFLPAQNDLHIYSDLNELLEFHANPKYYMSSGYLETLIRHRNREKKRGNGFGYRVVNLPENKHPVANTILATGGSGKERNLVFDPQEGIAGKIVPSKDTPLNDLGIRVMTPREWGKLQGFIGYAFIVDGKDTFSFPKGISDAQKYKQFGNSVTIPVIETMAQFMTDCFKQLGELK